MTFVEQGVKQPLLSCFIAEHDHLSRSAKTSVSNVEMSLLDEHSKMQDLFAVRAPDCISKGSTADGSTLQMAASPAIPHWMSSTQGLEVRGNTSFKNGLTANMTICKPQALQQNLHSHSQELQETFGTLSSPSLGIHAERQNDSSIVMQSRAEAPNSTHLFRKKLPTRALLSAVSKPPQGCVREEQREDSKVDLVSFLLHKQQRQEVKECPKAFSGLPLVGKTSDKKSEVSSWVSKFPFQIGPEADLGQLGGPTSGRNKDFFMRSNCPSQLASVKNHIDHSNVLIQHSSSLMEAAKSMKTQASSPSKWAFPGTLLGSDMPSLKRDWNATLMQSVNKHPQILPDFFAQQKVSNSERPPEIKCKDFFLHTKESTSRVSEEIADRNKNFLVGHCYINQQEPACGREAPKQLSHSSSLQVDVLKVKIEASSEDFEASECANLVLRESMEKNLKSGGDFEGKFFTAVNQAARQPSCVGLDVNTAMSNAQATELMLFAECASSQLLGNSSNASASAPPFSFINQPYNCKGLERGKMVPEGDWGKFLAGSRIEEAVETNAKIMLPFQQRFEQLQDFLRKCDGSEKEYCQRAFYKLSTSAQNDHATELESRALRLSLEEGKEMKRAKLLNVFEEAPEGPFSSPCSRPLGTCFLVPKASAIVKEEA